MFVCLLNGVKERERERARKNKQTTHDKQVDIVDSPSTLVL